MLWTGKRTKLCDDSLCPKWYTIDRMPRIRGKQDGFKVKEKEEYAADKKEDK